MKGTAQTPYFTGLGSIFFAHLQCLCHCPPTSLKQWKMCRNLSAKSYTKTSGNHKYPLQASQLWIHDIGPVYADGCTFTYSQNSVFKETGMGKMEQREKMVSYVLKGPQIQPLCLQ